MNKQDEDDWKEDCWARKFLMVPQNRVFSENKSMQAGENKGEEVEQQQRMTAMARMM